MPDFGNICSQMVIAASEAAKFISSEARVFDKKQTEVKGLHDFVSYVDKGSEEILVKKLEKIFPEAGFLAEEGTSTRKGEKYCWVIDPLDGTTNFLHGIHPHAISIALIEENEPVAGVIYEVRGKEVFYAWKGGGAWMNGERIKVSEANLLSDSLIATGFPYHDFGRLDKFMVSLSHFCKTTHGIRRLGSASIDLAYVACGRFEAFYEYGLNRWDIAAGIIIVREAGGYACDFSGKESNLNGEEIIATNSNVYQEFLRIVSTFMS